MREIPVLWKGGRQHYPNSSQRHCFTAGQPNNRHYGQSKTTSRLPCLTRTGNPDIFSERHGIGSTQQRRLSLNKIKARSRAGGHFFLSSDAAILANNGAILNVAQIIKNVMSSAAAAELGAIYIMAGEAVYIQHILNKMGHKQPANLIQTNNLTVKGVINSKITPKQTKVMDMRFFWLRDQETQEHFRFFWRAEKLNLADYWTEHHQTMHHRNVRNKYLTQKKVLHELCLRLAKGESCLLVMSNHGKQRTSARVCRSHRD